MIRTMPVLALSLAAMTSTALACEWQKNADMSTNSLTRAQVPFAPDRRPVDETGSVTTPKDAGIGLKEPVSISFRPLNTEPDAR